MYSHPDLAPAMRNTHEKNHGFLTQARLGTRNPAGSAEWSSRYAERFSELYVVDDSFRELVNGELTDDRLTRIQERLDMASEHRA